MLLSKLRNVLIATNTSCSTISGFKSKVSLEKLYPQSSLNIFESRLELKSDPVQFNGYIPMKALDITYARSSGPGGQSVNKSNSKVDVRFRLDEASWLPASCKEKMKLDYPRFINSDGYFIVRSERTSSQQMNVADALDKLRYMIQKSTLITKVGPTSDDIEIRRRRQEKAARERLRQKRMHSDNKRSRRGEFLE